MVLGEAVRKAHRYQWAEEECAEATASRKASAQAGAWRVRYRAQEEPEEPVVAAQ